MKKLLILLMVFAMASSASAGMCITVGPEGGGMDIGGEYIIQGGETIWLGIYAEDMPDDGQFDAILSIADDYGRPVGCEWTGDNNVYIPPAIPQAYNYYYGYEPGYGDLWTLTNSYDDPCSIGSDGLHADFEYFSVASGESISIKLLEFDLITVLDTLTILHAAIEAALISFNPSNLSFSCIEGGQNPTPQTLLIWDGGSGPLLWEITDGCDWLAADPCSGVCVEQEIDQVTVSVNASGLTAGVYNCDLEISDPSAVNSPQTVPVELKVFARGDFDMDGEVNCDDLRVLALAFMSKSGDDNWNPVCDISDPNDEVIDGQDFGVFAMYWEGCGDPPPEPGMSYNIEDCDPGAKAAGPDKNGLRFSITVEGNSICFEDMMEANCCPDELLLEMTVEDDLITIYEIEHTTMGCYCICDFPVTANLGPFNAGTYTLEVYEYCGGFIGSTIVIIE